MIQYFVHKFQTVLILTLSLLFANIFFLVADACNVDKVDYSTFYKKVTELSKDIAKLRHDPENPMILGICIETSIHAIAFMISAFEDNAFYYIDPNLSCPIQTLKAVKPEYVVVPFDKNCSAFKKWDAYFPIKTKLEVFGKQFAIFDLYQKSFHTSVTT